MLGVSARLVVTDNIGFCPHPQGVRPETNGFSPGLKNMPQACFLPSQSDSRPLRIPHDDKNVGIAFAIPTFLVGVSGFEPEASWTRTKRDTKLRHTPIAQILY